MKLLQYKNQNLMHVETSPSGEKETLRGVYLHDLQQPKQRIHKRPIHA